MGRHPERPVPVLEHGTDPAAAKRLAASAGLVRAGSRDKFPLVVVRGTKNQISSAGRQPGVSHTGRNAPNEPNGP